MLALDGGGVRGIVTLGYLEQIETILRSRLGDDCRLCDYFDLIGGTSTGAIIAAGLAMGLRVARLQELYKELASEVFKKQFWRMGVIGAKFSEESLDRHLGGLYGDATLGSDKLQTGLMIVTKRLDTSSPWVIHNNPRGKYFSAPEGQGAYVGNRGFPVRQVVRASTAAPHYFQPERLKLGEAVDGAFLDGGVSPFNNPALQLLLLASLEGYGFNWPLGGDKALLVSVGTGTREQRYGAGEVMEMPAALLTVRSLMSLVRDCDWLTQMVLQWMSKTPTPWTIDGEVGDLQGDLLGGQAWLSYVRYNMEFDPTWFQKNLGVNFDQERIDHLFAMDEAKNVFELGELGRAAGSSQVKAEHFPAVFDCK
jgi:hypothetical protein